MQYNVLMSLSFLIMASPLHTGQCLGISILLLLVKLSETWGIIIFALYTLIVSPIPSSNSSSILKL